MSTKTDDHALSRLLIAQGVLLFCAGLIVHLMTSGGLQESPPPAAFVLYLCGVLLGPLVRFGFRGGDERRSP